MTSTTSTTSSINTGSTGSVPPSKTYCPESNKEASFFGRVYKVLYCGTYRFFDGAARLFSKTDGLDKFLKLLSGIFLAVQVQLGVLATPLLTLLQGRFKSINDTISGTCNLPGRFNDFTDSDKSGKVKLLQQSYAKITSRALLVLVNVFETVKMLTDWGVKSFGKAAAAMGNSPVFKVFYNAGMSSVKNVVAFTCFTFSVIDALMSLYKGVDGSGKKIDEKATFMTLLNDAGKCALIAFSSSFFTLGFAALSIFTNGVAITKILYSDYKNKPFTA